MDLTKKKKKKMGNGFSDRETVSAQYLKHEETDGFCVGPNIVGIW
jgi:hypothetical protein